MTRRDLEEAIMNLEYLVRNHSDANKRDEYGQQLQSFRLELQAMDQLQRPLAADRRRGAA